MEARAVALQGDVNDYETSFALLIADYADLEHIAQAKLPMRFQGVISGTATGLVARLEELRAQAEDLHKRISAVTVRAETAEALIDWENQ